MMTSQKVPHPVTPAKAGVHNYFNLLDSGFRRNDGKEHFSTFCETIKDEMANNYKANFLK